MHHDSRRRLLLGAGAGVLVLGCAHADAVRAASPKSAECGGGEDVTPSEDLMREHGLLNRVLLIYEEGARRLESGPAPAVEQVAAAADIVRRFIEAYHEKLEEEFLFPRFVKQAVLVDLVNTLRTQHHAGRGVTETVLRLATRQSMERLSDRTELVVSIRRFIRMYRPHEAREDTVLFPALPRVFSADELREMGERFEDREHELFGKQGFEGEVEKVAELEQALGIHELSQFTPA